MNKWILWLSLLLFLAVLVIIGIEVTHPLKVTITNVPAQRLNG